MKKLDKTWFQAAFVRAIRTMAQTMLGMIGVGAAFFEVNWVYILSVALVSGLVSILTSIAGLPEIEVDGHAYIDEALGTIVAGDVDIEDKDYIRLKLNK